jgi:hypothetical protein
MSEDCGNHKNKSYLNKDSIRNYNYQEEFAWQKCTPGKEDSPDPQDHFALNHQYGPL